MSATEPQLSVLMTAFNRELYIAEAIESVLESTFTDFELIIVDDCSVDDTINIAQSYADRDKRITVYKNDKNLGDYPNRNKAAGYAKGKYIKYVDSDDKVSPVGLQIMMDAMKSFPDAAFGFSDCKVNSDTKYPLYYTGEAALRKHFFDGGFLQAGPSTTIINRAVFIKKGGFSGKRFVSDYESWLELCLFHPVVVFTPGIMWVRSHQGQEMDVGKLSYYSLNYNLHRYFLLHTNNPFSKKEREQLWLNYRILFSRRIYQRLLKWFGLKKTLTTIANAGEDWRIFFYAILPMKKFINS